MPFQPGQSGNPGGRPRGAAGLARYIAEQTKDGRELVDRLLELSRTGEPRESGAATLALLDRMVGKPLQSIDMQALVATKQLGPPAGWDAMSIEQRRAALDELEQGRAPIALPTSDYNDSGD